MPSTVRRLVANRPISSMVPATAPISTYSPTLNGLSANSMMPAAMFCRVPCKASPRARPMAPIAAMIEAVCTPNWPSTMTMTSARMA